MTKSDSSVPSRLAYALPLIFVLALSGIAFAQSVGYGADYSSMWVVYVFPPLILIMAIAAIAGLLLLRYSYGKTSFVWIQGGFLLIIAAILLLNVLLSSTETIRVAATALCALLVLGSIYRFKEYSNALKLAGLGLLCISFPIFVGFGSLASRTPFWIGHVLVDVGLAALLFWKVPKKAR
ncbi:Uncharacterised protein [uncultured archaeon]|nr:Uncharacterised protein [uncultured archaeon]